MKLKRNTFKNIFNYPLAVLLTIMVLISTQASSEECKSLYEVTTSELNIRDKPGRPSNIVGTVKKGDEVCVDNFEGKWGQTKDGWVSGKYLQLIPSAESSTSTSVDNINIVVPEIQKNKEESLGFMTWIVIIVIIAAIGKIFFMIKKRRRISSGEYWIGMRENDLTRSLGEPVGLDKKKMKTTLRETWKYDNGLKVTLENGKVTGWTGS